MKRTGFLITLCLPFVLAANILAGEVALQWNANTETDLSGYNLYYGTSSRQYGAPLKVGKATSYTVPNLNTGTSYYFALTALDTSGNESGYSTEIKAAAQASTSGGTGGTGQTTVAMWWTQYNTRPTAAPVKIYDGATLLATVNVNQQTNGGKWNTLGSYTFKGTPKVVVVAQAGAGSTCADAVRFTAPDGTAKIIDNGQSGTSTSGSWPVSGGANPYGANSLYSKDGSYTFDAAGGTASSPPPATSQTAVAMWWTQYNTRPTAVPVKIYDGATLLATVNVNQQTNGGKWNTLGSYTFKGTPKVVVVAQAGAGSTCADAVRFTAPDGTAKIIDNGQSGTSASGSWPVSGGANPYGANSLYSKDGSYTFDASGATASSPPPATSQTALAMWWTEYNSRPTAVPVKIYDGATLLATVNVNQQTDGGQWNTLGAYTFAATPKVVVVAQAGAGSTCADAVRFTAPDGTTKIIDNGQSGTSASGSWPVSGGASPYGANSLYSKDGSYTFAVN